MSHDRTRILVTSLGSIGRRHLDNLGRLRPDAELGVLRLTGGGDTQPLPDSCNHVFRTLEDAIAFAPQCAIIASPASIHLELATALLSQGIAVLVEKPLSNAIDGARELVLLAAKKKLPLMVGYNLRFQPSLAKAKALIDEGAVGRILSVQAQIGQYLPSWRPGTDYRKGVSAQAALGGGALLELSHELDYIYWMFGLPDTIYCAGGRLSEFEVDVEDCAEILLEYSGPNRIVNVHMDFLQSPASRSCRFTGSGGTIMWDGIADTVTIQPHSGGRAPHTIACKTDRNQMYLDELDHFLECVARRTVPAIDGQQGYDVLAMVAAARRSMIERRPVRPEGFSNE